MELYNKVLSALVDGDKKTMASGLALIQPTEVTVGVASKEVRLGRSYEPLPDWIRFKRAVVNVRNEDDNVNLFLHLASLQNRLAGIHKQDSR